jgi:hypothetical protein
MLFIDKLKKYFVMDMKSNRLCMFATQDRNKGQWTSLDKLPLQPEQPVKVWIKDLEIEVVLCKFVFTNKDERSLACGSKINNLANLGTLMKILVQDKKRKNRSEKGGFFFVSFLLLFTKYFFNKYVLCLK